MGSVQSIVNWNVSLCYVADLWPNRTQLPWYSAECPDMPSYFNAEFRILATTIQSLIFIIGLFGNCMVILVVKRSRTMHTPTNCYLVSLSMADLLLLLSAVPEAVWSYYQLGLRWGLGSYGCAVAVFAQYLSINVSASSIFAFTVERYVAVCHPLQAQKICTTQRALRIIAGIWIFGFIYCLPWLYLATTYPLLYRGIEPLERCGHRLRRDQYLGYYFSDFFLFYVLPLILIVIMYARIAVYLVHSGEQLRATRGGQLPSAVVTGQFGSYSLDGEAAAAAAAAAASPAAAVGTTQKIGAARALAAVVVGSAAATATPSKRNSSVVSSRSITSPPRINNKMKMNFIDNTTSGNNNRSNSSCSAVEGGGLDIPNITTGIRVSRSCSSVATSGDAAGAGGDVAGILSDGGGADETFVRTSRSSVGGVSSIRKKISSAFSGELPEAADRRGSYQQYANGYRTIAKLSTTSSVATQRSASAFQARVKVIQMLVVVTVMFAVLWLPYRALMVYNSLAPLFGRAKLDDLWVLLFVKTLIYMNSSINPILYSALSLKFRRAFRGLLTCQSAERANLQTYKNQHHYHNNKHQHHHHNHHQHQQPWQQLAVFDNHLHPPHHSGRRNHSHRHSNRQPLLSISEPPEQQQMLAVPDSSQTRYRHRQTSAAGCGQNAEMLCVPPRRRSSRGGNATTQQEPFRASSHSMPNFDTRWTAIAHAGRGGGGERQSASLATVDDMSVSSSFSSTASGSTTAAYQQHNRRGSVPRESFGANTSSSGGKGGGSVERFNGRKPDLLQSVAE